MPVDHIRYDLLIQDALRGVVRTVLADVAVNGLPGDHHFYITFDTRFDGVRLSARQKASYPEEMMIVLQRQFWDLKVEEDGFDVGLSFNGIPERLHIPFRAVKVFVDPSVPSFADPAVPFILQFAVDREETQGPLADGAETRAETAAPAAEALPAKEPAAEPAAPDESAQSAPAKEEGSAEVVRLDRFRKK